MGGDGHRGRPSFALPSIECRGHKRNKKTKIYKNFIPLVVAFLSQQGHGLIPAVLREILRMDAIYLLIIVALYLTTHGLVWAFGRLGKTS
jgi:hypothetical protein